MFVCFKGGMGTGALPDECVCICRKVPRVESSLCTITVVSEPEQKLNVICYRDTETNIISSGGCMTLRNNYVPSKPRVHSE